jgi:esterase/lipase/1-acyl-sn-glycerol-3-phosphate acyltransferase
MPSEFFMKTTAKTLQTLFKFSGADIRVHGEEYIPDRPILFVVNHFTRIETTFIPYIIHKYSNRIPVSLAHHSFFGGKFGNLLTKLGAISTNDPGKYKVITRSLLLGDMPVIIFPEGQMLKDKKLIEKGKYMVYNAGIRRPPHTGAAVMTLRAEFYRAKIIHFVKKNQEDKLNTIKEFFNLTDENIKKIISQTSLIVPVNITYFPIRAKKNAILKIANKLFSSISDRFEEELEVEGTMLMDGVDIDINFGKPIEVVNYFDKTKEAKKNVEDSQLYLLKDEIKKHISMRGASVKLMKRYMDEIYGLTTINHDHIFSYILTTSPKKKMLESTLKNKAFLAIEKIKKTGQNNIHTSLVKNQFHLLTDDEHKIYESFIEAARSDNLIEVKDGIIYKKHEKFNKQYKFHTVRKDNIIAVIKNEIEPLGNIIKLLHKSIVTIPSFDKRKIRNLFFQIDQDLFEKDYKRYFLEGESKPADIGKPFYLKRFMAKKGVILVHGYMAAPEEMRLLGEYLYKKGYSVYGARLRGHGTAPEDLARREWTEWYNSVNRAYIIMDNSVKNLSIIGFSTGAGLALLQGINKKRGYDGIISINAPLKLVNISSHLSSAVVAWNKFLNKINVEKGKLEFVENDPENAHINYIRNPLYGVNQLGKLMDRVEDKLENLETSALIIQGSDDPVVNPLSGIEIFNKIGTEDKELYRIFSKRHGIVRGDELDKVATKVTNFFKYVFK